MAEIEIKLDKRNYRIHNDKNKDLIRKSLSDCGTGRSIVADADGVIIAGNGIYEQAKKMGIPVKIIRTNGEKLIALKRTDIKKADKKRNMLAAFDNTTSDASDNNQELLREDFAVEELLDLGIVSIADVNAEIDEEIKKQDSSIIECPSCGYVGSENEFLIKGEK